MTTHSWICSLFTRPARPNRKTPPRLRLAVEALDDRCVPATLTVTRSADDVNQNHTLRYALAHAQSGDIIQLTPAIKAPIVLTQGELVVSEDVTIRSVGNQTPTISGNNLSRVFEISAGATVTLDSLNIIDGNAAFNDIDHNGGGILSHGTLTVTGCTLSGNSGDSGGGIASYGTITVTGCHFSDNSAGYGGGGFLNAWGTATVTGCTLTDNFAIAEGGGMSNYFGTMTVIGCTLTDNSSDYVGGGLVSHGTMTVTDCTLTDNSADYYGGGIANWTGTTTVTGCTLSDNSAGVVGGGLWNFATMEVGASDFTGNTPENIFGSYVDLGGNTGL